LQGGADEAGLFFGGDFYGEVEALGLGVGGVAGSRLAGLDSMTKVRWFGSCGEWEQEERKKEKRKTKGA
jgi:hypothetical protein